MKLNMMHLAAFLREKNVPVSPNTVTTLIGWITVRSEYPGIREVLVDFCQQNMPSAGYIRLTQRTARTGVVLYSLKYTHRTKGRVKFGETETLFGPGIDPALYAQAGRPRVLPPDAHQVTILIQHDMYQTLGDLRGRIPLSAFIRDMITEGIERIRQRDAAAGAAPQ